MLLTGGERILLVIGIVTTYNRSGACGKWIGAA